MKLLSQAVNCTCQWSFCGGKNIKIVDDGEREGIVCNLQIVCEDCNINTDFKTSTCRNRRYEANIRLAYGLRCIGVGNLLCGIMNMPCPQSKFTAANHILHNAIQEVSQESMNEAPR